MKIIKSLTAAIVAIAIFSSCQKEYSIQTGTTTPGPVSSDVVKTYTEDITSPLAGHFVNTYNLAYDANGRITSLVSVTSPGDKIVYQYNPDNTYTMDIYNSNSISVHELFYINSLGLVDSTVQNDGTDTTTEKYLYNSVKQLVKLKEYTYTTAGGSVLENTVNYELDNNGNVTKETDNTSETTYEYYPNLANNITLGQLYFFRSKNLPKTTTIKQNLATETINHTYTYDSSNRLTSEKIEFSSGVVVIRAYTY